MDETMMAVLENYISSKILKQAGRQIGTDAALISSGLIDSFSLVDLALFVEDSFGVRIEDTELNAQCFDTLRQLTALIESRQAK
jgi:acyl carrier protein